MYVDSKVPPTTSSTYQYKLLIFLSIIHSFFSNYQLTYPYTSTCAMWYFDMASPFIEEPQADFF
jgi:hypothetical protein